MQSTGQTVAQDWQLVQESLLMTLRYRVSFFRSSLRVAKYSVTDMVIAGCRAEGADAKGARATIAGPSASLMTLPPAAAADGELPEENSRNSQNSGPAGERLP